MARESGIKFICDLCGQLIEIGRPRYILKGDITCAYDGGTFDETSEMRNTTFEEEVRRLIALAETRTEKELNDEVHYPFKMDLCASCRRKIYGILERNVALE
ncbi:MAG: hypothetical protein ACOX5R_08635 [bacterium]|jgi:hypothetical protein